MNPNNAAGVMAVTIVILVSTLRLKSKLFPKPLRFVMLGVLVVALLATRSRAGLICLATPVFLMSLWGKNKAYAWVFIILALITVGALPAMREATFERFTERTHQGLGGFWAPIEERYWEVARSWGAANARRMIFGQNVMVDTLTGFMAPHSAYLGIPLEYGIGGTVWFIVFIVLLVRKSGAMKRHPDVTIASLGAAIRWSLVTFAMYGVVSGFLDSYVLRDTFFLLAVFAHRGAELMAPTAAWPGSNTVRPHRRALFPRHEAQANYSYRGTRT
ncbi:MAG: hypothetical protein V2A79_13875 [Planctomycetota bacterium]